MEQTADFVQKRWENKGVVKKIILILLGVLGLIVGIPLALAGGGLLAVGGRDGALQSGWHRVDSPTVALVTDANNLGNASVETGGTAVSIVVEARNSNKPVFLGVAKAQDVENYLRGAASDEITSIDFNPFKLETVRETGSLASVSPPGNQNFWVAQSSGVSPELTWKVTGDGTYRAVVMNADGTANLSTDLSLGLKAPAIFGVGLGLLIAGLVISVIGLALLLWGIFAKRKKPLPPGAPAPLAADYPTTGHAAVQDYTPGYTQPGNPAPPGSAPPTGGTYPPA
ncbi:hypothetical protein [Catelliglobosispora koreensis]|uniref:hypothetical protein n=1 Tax=Catelliglobosispora koreensis TaxID=129052 RepID=UPI00036B0310|nr:hypothetical protein [Catelliglobosispora koreensis]